MLGSRSSCPPSPTSFRDGARGSTSYSSGYWPGRPSTTTDGTWTRAEPPDLGQDDPGDPLGVSLALQARQRCDAGGLVVPVEVAHQSDEVARRLDGGAAVAGGGTVPVTETSARHAPEPDAAAGHQAGSPARPETRRAPI